MSYVQFIARHCNTICGTCARESNKAPATYVARKQGCSNLKENKYDHHGD